MNPSDPLSQLKDIHLPDAVGLWPPAPGWWLLAIVFVCVIGLAIYFMMQSIAKNRYRHGAETLSNQIWQDYQTNKDAHLYLQQLTAILRRTAIAAYPSQQVKSLHGDAWLQFLDATAKSNGSFSDGVGRQLLSLPYQPIITTDLAPLHDLVTAWITQHKRHLTLTPGDLREARHA